MFHDFMIHYRKDKLNPVDRSSRHLNYMNENKESNTIITRLIFTLLNKLCPDKLEFKELTITLLKVSK